MDSLIETYKMHIPALPNWLQCISDGVWTDTRERHVMTLTPEEVNAIGERYRSELLEQWQKEWQEEQAQLAQQFPGCTGQYFLQHQTQAVMPLPQEPFVNNYNNCTMNVGTVHVGNHDLGSQQAHCQEQTACVSQNSEKKPDSSDKPANILVSAQIKSDGYNAPVAPAGEATRPMVEEDYDSFWDDVMADAKKLVEAEKLGTATLPSDAPEAVRPLTDEKLASFEL
ncbi:hypothetical protein N0V86_008982 [Didymella sp. IMI 355093]|nr:hypothetical protein N0V86_008982 [Didymella sp. IMI 355093]